MFNTRPPAPRYDHIWKVDKVLQYIQLKFPSNDALSIKDLSEKLVILLALATASRSSDLVLWNIRHIRFFDTNISVRLAGLSKTRRSGPPRVVNVARLSSDPILCPIAVLEVYLKKSASWRSTPAQDQLVLSFRKPHKPMTSSTIARWIKSVLMKPGIDVSIFKAHSTRAASTSAAADRGVSSNDILKMADWSRESTFARFYHKPIIDEGTSFESILTPGT